MIACDTLIRLMQRRTSSNIQFSDNIVLQIYLVNGA